MSVSSGCRAAVTGVFLSIAVFLASGKVQAQQASRYLPVPSGTGSTVSVATLRIPEKAWRHFSKAKAAAEHNHMAESDRETEKAIAIAPDFAVAYLLRADAEVKEHLFDEAIANVREAMRVEPGILWGGVVLAGAYNGLHRYGEARTVLQGIHGVESAAWQTAYESARASIGLKDVEGALHWSAVALDGAPQDFEDAHLVRTNALLLAQRWGEAQAQIELYLQSSLPQQHRPAALAALETVKQRVREEELRSLASR